LWDPEISRGGRKPHLSGNAKNKGERGQRQGKEGVAGRREPSFNFLLAAA